MTSIKLTRRAMLCGMGATVALPALDAMFDSRGRRWLLSGKASAQAEPTKFIVFHWPYGIPHYVQGADPGENDQASFWFPTPANASATVQNFTASPAALKPLLEGGKYGNFRNDINIVSGLTLSPVGHDGDACSHGHATTVFTGMKTLRTAGACDERAGGPSVDTMASKAFGEAEPLALMLPNGNGTTRNSASYGGDYWRWSNAAASKPNNITWLPSQLLKNVFTLAQLSTEERLKYQKREKSVIDFVKRDAERLSSRLGAADRMRLDQHLDTIRSIENSVLGATATASCGDPNIPADDYGFLNGSDYQDFDRYAEDMIRLGVLALSCGARRTLFISLGPSQNDDGRLSHIDPAFKYSIHACQHGNGASDIEGHKQWRKITLWQMEKLAYTLYQLKGGAGGAAGSILDRSVFVSTSEFVSGFHYPTFLPVIVAGKAKAMTTGKHIAYANTENTAPTWARSLPGRKNPCISDLWLTALRGVGAFGANDAFAPASGYTAQALTELWAG